MRRMSRLDVLGIAACLVIAQACSGPTHPSKTATSTPPSPPPSPTGAAGTIAFVSANPAPGSEVVLDPSAPGATPSLTATFSVTLDKAVADAMVDVQLFDGTDHQCGSGLSGQQSVEAGKAATFTVDSISFSCALPATVEKLQAKVVTAASGQTEFAATSLAARYAFRAPGAPAATVTLSGTVTAQGTGALAGATVEITDGANTGKSTRTDGTGHYSLAGLQPGPATVRASKDDYDNTYIRVTLSAGSATQDLALSKPTRSGPGSASIAFVSSDPSPGAEIVIADAAGLLYVRDLKLRFAVQIDTALPDAKLEVELLGDAGQQCAFTFVDQAVAANQSVPVTVNGLAVWQGCNAFPVGIATVKATLLTLREPLVNGRLQRTDYASQSFALRYTIRRYPDPPPTAPASLPVISELSRGSFIPTGGDPPIPGDPLTLTCVAKEADGAPLTVVLTLTWDGLPPKSKSLAFPAGASSSEAGARVELGDIAPQSAYGAPHAKVECVGTNSRGESARKTLEFGVQR